MEAANSIEALKTLEQHGDVQVLFTDINMPREVVGFALAELVHKLHPEIELVVTSGERGLSDSSLPDHGTFLPKSYRLTDLIEVIGLKPGLAN